MNLIKKTLLTVALILLVALIGVRVALPSIIKNKANETLDTLKDYKGHVGDVDLGLWRGAFFLQDLKLKHRNEDTALTIKEIEFNLSWPSLLRKTLVADLVVRDPRMRMLVPSPLKAAKETKEKVKDVDETVKAKTGKSLPDMLAELIPFRIDRFRLEDGTVRIREKGQNIDREAKKDEQADEDSEKEDQKESEAELRITDLNVDVKNLTNSKKVSRSLMAEGRASAKIMDTAPVHFDLKLNPTAEAPTFDMNLEVEKFELIHMNPVFRWQWGVDAEKGTFSMFAEAAASQGAFKGYVKPLIEDLKMVNLERDKAKPLKVIKEAVVGAVASILENKKADRVATRVPFEGRFDNPRVGIWQAILTVLRNAFIEALKPSLDKTIELNG
jgi:hypothetical protein